MEDVDTPVSVNYDSLAQILQGEAKASVDIGSALLTANNVRLHAASTITGVSEYFLPFELPDDVNLEFEAFAIALANANASAR